MGLFITFEGGDGAGKSSLIDKIYEELSRKAKQALKTKAPGGTKIGEAIRNLLLHSHTPLNPRTELFLFLADRAQHVEEVIKPALQKGVIVLCDRYNDSTLAYQGAARGLDGDFLHDLCHFATNGLNPDLTLYLDLDPKIGFERLKKAGLTKDRIESEDIDFHQKIRNGFLKIAHQEPKRFRVIDASQTPDSVFAHAMREINAFF